MTTVRFFFPILSLIVVSIHLTNAATKCNAVCYLNAFNKVKCSVIGDIHHSEKVIPINCQKNDYVYSTEVIIGNFQEVAGIQPNGFDIFQHSEGKVKVQLTIKLKIERIDAGLFDNLTNLIRLEVHPLSVDPCAFYTLPKGVKDVLLQCVSPKMRMLDDLYWPTNSATKFKINMCLQSPICYNCQPTATTPYQYSVIKSQAKGPLQLNTIVSLKNCRPKDCTPKVTSCLKRIPTTTTTTTTTTKKPTPKTTTSTTTTPRPVQKLEPRRPLRNSHERTTKRPPTYETRKSGAGAAKNVDRKEPNFADPEKTQFYVFAVLGATVINTLILLVIMFLILYASGCCTRRTPGVFVMSKDTYPPEYNSLRPVR